MPHYVPVTAERHAQKRWQRFSSYAFAERDAVVPLVAAEFAKAALALPIALVPRGSAGEGSGFMFAAVLGLEPGASLFVAADGRWLGRYVPSALRSHPFRLIQAENDKLVLCVDEESGLVGEYGEEAFFDETGEIATSVKQVMEFLTQIERNRAATLPVCDLLNTHGLIQPWPVKIEGDAGERTLTGLYRIDEAALNALPVQALGELRDAGGLSMAYCQLLSMQNLALLSEIARARSAQAPKLDDVFSFQDDGVLHFGDS